LKAIDSYIAFKGQHKQNVWNGIGIGLASVAGFGSFAIGRFAGAFVGAGGAIASVKSLLLGKTNLLQKKKELNRQFNAKVATDRRDSDGRELRDLMNRFYVLSDYEQKMIRHALGQEIPEAAPPIGGEGSQNEET
jgi:hypothetical protein